MARPAKSLAQHIRDGSFMPSRHERLLAGVLVSEPCLRMLQERWRAEGSRQVRRQIAGEFAEAAAVVARTIRSSPLEAIRGMDFAMFCETFLRLRKGWSAGSPFRLEAWQRKFYDAFSEVDGDGRRVFSTGFLMTPRGSGKTFLADAVALFELLRRSDEPEILFASASREQAGNVALEYVKSLIRSSDALAELLVVKGDEIVVPETSGRMRTVSTGGGAFGGSPAVAVIDEPWLFDRDAQTTMWEGLQTGLGKTPDGFALVTSTAPSSPGTFFGELLERELAKPGVEHVHEALTVVGDRVGGVFTTWYGARSPDCDVDDERLWMLANPASWVDVKTLRKRRHAPGISDATFRKLHLNTPGTESEETLVTAADWRACTAPGLEPHPEQRIVAGVDRCRERDTVAVAWVWDVGDDQVGAACRVWSTNKRVAAHEHPHYTSVSLEPVETLLADLAERYKLTAVCFDPRRLRRLQTPVRVTKIRNGSPDQRRVSSDLCELVADRMLNHSGDPVLEASMFSARGVPDPSGVKVYPLDKHGRADAVYALVNALTAFWDAAPSVYQHRGVTMLDTGPPPLPLEERDVASFYDPGAVMLPGNIPDGAEYYPRATLIDPD